MGGEVGRSKLIYFTEECKAQHNTFVLDVSSQALMRKTLSTDIIIKNDFPDLQLPPCHWEVERETVLREDGRTLCFSARCVDLIFLESQGMETNGSPTDV